MTDEKYLRYKNLSLDQISPRLSAKLGKQITAENLERFSKPVGEREAMEPIVPGAVFFVFVSYDLPSQNMAVVINENSSLSNYDGVRSEQSSIGEMDKLGELSRWAFANLLYILENPDVPRQLIPVD
jgi:hypothetical protein